MFRLYATDIPLLYKSLVVLPQDKQDLTSITKEISIDKSTEQEVLPENTAEQKIETQENISPVKKQDTQTPAVIPVSIAQEPKGSYETKLHPFALFTSETNKSKYIAEGSNFGKAAGALNITQLAKYITTDTAVLETLTSYECIWCMGIDLSTEKKILGLKHKNILISPDIESLTTVEEKKSMFSALKEFANFNMALFSKM